MEIKTQKHNIAPVYDEKSRILILGSFPSVKSREMQFFYGHPQNRFWKLLAELLEEEQPQTIEDKRRLLLTHGIAVWDVIESCEIAGSSDSSITAVKVNDLSKILKEAPVQAIFLNGAKAYELFRKYNKGGAYPPIYKLPSTSPANAAWRLDRLKGSWKVILDYLPGQGGN